MGDRGFESFSLQRRVSVRTGDIGVFKRRGGTPLMNRPKVLRCFADLAAGWGPDRHRLGPHQCGGSNRWIKGIRQNPAGSQFDADSHRSRAGATSDAASSLRTARFGRSPSIGCFIPVAAAILDRRLGRAGRVRSVEPRWPPARSLGREAMPTGRDALCECTDDSLFGPAAYAVFFAGRDVARHRRAPRNLERNTSRLCATSPDVRPVAAACGNPCNAPRGRRGRHLAPPGRLWAGPALLQRAVHMR
jgi:hypothetical protein